MTISSSQSTPMDALPLAGAVLALGDGSTSSLLIVATCVAGLLSVLFVLVFTGGRKPKTTLPLDDFITIPLIEKEVLSHDTAKFTFALPSPDHVLGLPVGQHITLKFTDTSSGKAVQRSYTPVTDALKDAGKVSLVIKIYRKAPPKFPDGGQMSQHLDSLKIGDAILMKGPKGHLTYKGHGRFSVKPLGRPLEERSARQICMMAGGTGITPMLQVLHAIFRDRSDAKTRVKLIYANQTASDILVRQELEELAKDFPTRFSLWYTVDRVDGNGDDATSWHYDTGFINKTMLEQHLLFEKREGTQFFICGPPPMIKFACQPALEELGFSAKDWVIF
jgi:cytochrome-b5 reductase